MSPKTDEAKIEALNQLEADNYIKKFWRCWNVPRITVDFNDVFSVENARKEACQDAESVMWALPSPNDDSGNNQKDRRKYFIVSSCQSEYLFGINQDENEKAMVISSFARVTPIPGRALPCLINLINDVIVPMCYATGKVAIIARLTPDGFKVFDKLRADKLCMIRKITVDPEGYYKSCTLELKPLSSYLD